MRLKMKIKFPSFPPQARRHRHYLGRVTTPEKGLGRVEWVLSRPLCRFSRFDLKSVPRAQRSKALALQIGQWAPFARTQWYLLWEEDCALVWAWDAERIGTAMSAEGIRATAATVVPETVLRDRHGDGAYLVAGLDGYEGLAWQNGSLMASRWWASVPAANEWINFQRDAGVLPAGQATEVPSPRNEPWQDRPWGRSASLDQTAVYEAWGMRWAVPLMALGLVVATLWYGVQLTKVKQGISARTAELERLSAQAGPVLEARGQALEALSRIHSLQAVLERYPDPLSVMGEVAKYVPKDGSHLKEWEFMNGRLRLQLASPNKLTVSDLVKGFQSAGFFRDVQAAPSSDPSNVTLNMEVVPLPDIQPRSQAGEGRR